MTADRRAAEAMADKLLTNGFGERADRLALMQSTWSLGGCGWGREALVAMLMDYGAQCRAEALKEEHERLAKSAKE